MSAVGIFWLYQGEVVFFAKQDVERAAVRTGVPIVDSAEEHAAYWEKLRAQGKLRVLPEDMRDEYFSVLRGRVVYDRERSKSIVYAGAIPSQDVRRKIIAAFELDAKHTTFATDEHYAAFAEDEWDAWRNR